MQKKKSKILSIGDIKKIGQTILENSYTDNKVYKLIHHAKSKGYLIAIKKDLFIPISPDKPLDDQQVVDRYYWPLLKKHVTHLTGRRRYISGLKSLEIISGNYMAPDNIDIVSTDSGGSTTLFLDKKVHIKTYTHQGQSLFPLLYRYSEPIKIGTITFRRAGVELALLESLHSPDIAMLAYTEGLIKRILKKHKRALDMNVIIALLRGGKHHSSINRLFHIALMVDKTLAMKLEDIIKKYSFVVEV